MSYHETTILARIKTVMESVSNIGKVYDYERWSKDWNTLTSYFKVTIGTTDQIRGWMISLRKWEEEIITFQGGGIEDTIGVDYTYRIRGFMGVDDDAATEKTFKALALSVAAALKADSTLAAYHLDDEVPTVESGLIEYRGLGPVLCHYVEITVRLQEVV